MAGIPPDIHKGGKENNKLTSTIGRKWNFFTKCYISDVDQANIALHAFQFRLFEIVG